MLSKRPVCPERVRRVPKQFSWVDHRLVRERRIDACTHASAALYLFLVTVADAQGLSYYSDASLMKRLRMDAPELEDSRRQLIHLGLVAFDRPIYQVLPLDPPAPEPASTPKRSAGDPQLLGDVFRRIMERAS